MAQILKMFFFKPEEINFYTRIPLFRNIYNETNMFSGNHYTDEHTTYGFPARSSGGHRARKHFKEIMYIRQIISVFNNMERWKSG